MSETHDHDSTFPEQRRDDGTEQSSAQGHDPSLLHLRRRSAVAPAVVSDNQSDVNASFIHPGAASNITHVTQLSYNAEASTTSASRPASAQSIGRDYFSPDAVSSHTLEILPPRRPSVQLSTISRQSTHSSEAADSASSDLSRVNSALARHLESQRETLAISSATARGLVESPHDTRPRFHTRRSATEHPGYPNQALIALQQQVHPSTHHPSHSSRPASGRHALQVNPNALGTSVLNDGNSDERCSRTAGNTPIQTPSLFAPRSHRHAAHTNIKEDASPFPSPYLHPVQPEAPKETTRAVRDVDSYSGRKTINQYEMLGDLGKGTHGKVKLAHNLDTGGQVAIKIVPRHSKKRRLGKAQKQEDRVKKEIAILKKALHPNVVRMVEVIDDPDLHKVYLVLEFCEEREVPWRELGNSEIVIMEKRRRDREAQGGNGDDAIAQSGRIMEAATRKREHAAQRKRPALSRICSESDFWSLEFAAESDGETLDRSVSEPVSRLPSASPDSSRLGRIIVEDSDLVDPLDSATRTPRPTNVSPTRQNVTDLSVDPPIPATRLGGLQHVQTEVQRHAVNFEESLYEIYGDMHVRKPSSVDSASSQLTELMEHEVEEELRYVPTLTLSESRSAFRDALLGLEYLHYQGIIHRDLKPENLLRKRDLTVKISDFGVSYLGKPIREGQESEEASETESQDHEEDTELAKTVGTPAFYAPELCSLDYTAETPAVTGQIDVWALGVTLFCLLFARTPFIANNEFVMMRRIAEEEVFIPRKRLKAVDDKSASRAGPYRHLLRKSKDHRLASELVYEEIDDDLYDLLKRLFLKDPRKRITVREIKHHPWILKDIPNPVAWLDETDSARFMQGKKIEISHQDMSDAVIPLKLIERAKSVAKKVGGVLGLGGSKPSPRRRGQSSTTSSESTTSSPGPFVPNIPGKAHDDFFNASHKPLKEREGEHPLSQSESASPEPVSADEPYHIQSPIHYSAADDLSDDPQKTIRRPAVRRHESGLSTAGSIRTLKQADISGFPAEEPQTENPYLPHDDIPSPSVQEVPHSASPLNAIFGGAGRNFMRTIRGRDRRGSDRSSRATSPSPSEQIDHRHSEPSIGFSNTSAAGSINLPTSNPESWPGLNQAQNQSHSKPGSGSVSLRGAAAANAQAMGSQRSSPMTESWEYRRNSAAGSGATSSKPGSPHTVRDSEIGDAPYNIVRDLLSRTRHMDFAHPRIQPDHALSPTGRSPSPTSPTDDAFRTAPGSLQREESSFLELRPRAQRGSVDRSPISLNSSEDHLNSGVSRSTSFPSVHSIVSADSSVSPDPGSTEYMTKHAQRLSSSACRRPSRKQSTASTPVTSKTGPVLALPDDDDDGYTGDNAVETDEDDSDSGGEDFLVMNRVKSQDHVRRYTERRSRRESRRSARSGSTNTVKKLPSKESSPQHDDRQHQIETS